MPTVVGRLGGLVLLVLTLAAGCSFAPAPAEIAPVTRIPDGFGEAAAIDRGPREAPTAWWTGFGDPVLDRIVDTAIVANLDIREAVARVEEVRAQYRISRSALFPSSRPPPTSVAAMYPPTRGSSGPSSAAMVTVVRMVRVESPRTTR